MSGYAGTLNLLQMRAYRSHWKWERMLGSSACLKWGFRDLRHLDMVLKRIPGRDLAVQAGGNLGLFPKRLAEEFKIVHAFEPSAPLFNAMKHNAPEPNIIAHHAALGFDRDPVSVVCKRRDNSGRAVHEGLTHIGSSPGDVKQIRIDDLNLEACDLIYLDIEGWELNALRGAAETVDKFRPAISVEINRNIAYYGKTASDVRRWFYDHQYARVLTMDSDELFVHGTKI